jgi:hypothetical protein
MAEGEPLELVRYNAASGRFEVGAAAAAVLRRTRGPVSIVAVAGRARQGKSYILNQLLRAAGGAGFAVGSTQRPCTKGLWMWSAPTRRVDADGGGGEYHLVGCVFSFGVFFFVVVVAWAEERPSCCTFARTLAKSTIIINNHHTTTHTQKTT